MKLKYLSSNFSLCKNEFKVFVIWRSYNIFVHSSFKHTAPVVVQAGESHYVINTVQQVMKVVVQFWSPSFSSVKMLCLHTIFSSKLTDSSVHPNLQQLKINSVILAISIQVW